MLPAAKQLGGAGKRCSESQFSTDLCGVCKGVKNMKRKEVIRSAYRLTGENNFYDGMITCTTLSGKAVCRLMWDMSKAG